MADQVSNLNSFEKINRLETIYKNFCVELKQADQRNEKSNSAGNELYDTLTDNFEKLFVKVDNLDNSDKIFDDFLTIMNEDNFTDVLLEMYNNLPKDFNSKIRENLRIIEKEKEESDSSESDSSFYSGSGTNSENESTDVEPSSRCRRSTRLQCKKNKYIQEIEENDNGLPSCESNGKKYESNDFEEENNQAHDNVSIQKVILDPVLQEKLESMIESDLKSVENIALDTTKVADKVKEVSSHLGISQRVIGPIVAKLSIGGFNDLMTRIKNWNRLKERMQDVFRRLYAWIINKEAILFVHSLCPKKTQYYGNEKITIPKPSYFWLDCEEPPVDEIERAITPPIAKYDDEETSKYGEFRPNIRVNKYIRTIESNPTNEEIFERTGKTYELQNKNILLSDIKYMTTKNFKFKGYLNTVDICKEIRKHLTETNCSQRNFAENILGMSQGSASDLLTKPKKWQGLTRRGREPYIKMRAYLDVYEGLKEELKAIVEVEEKEQLEKLKTLYKNKLEQSGKQFDSSSLFKVLDKFSKVQAPSEDREVPFTEPKPNNLSFTILNQNEQSIFKKTEAIFQNKQNFKVVAKIANTSNFSNNQLTNDNTANSTFISPITESLNTMSLAIEMKTLLEECKITPAIFAERFMNMKPQDFHRILTAPRAWNLSPLEDRKAYEKMKIFLNDNNFVKNFKEKGLDAFPVVLRLPESTLSSTPNSGKFVRFVKPIVPIDSTSSLCNSKVVKVCVKKRSSPRFANNILLKKQKLCDEYEKEIEDDDKLKKSNEEIKDEDEKNIQDMNSKTKKEDIKFVPFKKSVPLLDDQSSSSNYNKSIKKMKQEFDEKMDIENINTLDTKNTSLKEKDSDVQLKEELIEPPSEIIYQHTSSDDSFNSHEMQSDSHLANPQLFTRLHEDCFKPIHKEKVNTYDISTCHAKMIKKDDNQELLIDTAELEILYLAWTYNPNPQYVMKNYLSQMTVLPIETIETWYYTFNKLKGNYLRTADNSLTYRENLRKSVLTTTTRKKYLAVTDLVFKQLFSNKLAELMNQH